MFMIIIYVSNTQYTRFLLPHIQLLRRSWMVQISLRILFFLVFGLNVHLYRFHQPKRKL